MQPIEVQQSRTIPLALEDAFRHVIVIPLPVMFSRRHLLMPPIKEVRDQDGDWGVAIGQTRTIETSDGGVMHEELTQLDAPNLFGYDLTVMKGPMKGLVGGVKGQWRFAPDGDGTKVTWAWTLTPKSALTRPVLKLIARHWMGYAEKALEQGQVEAVRMQAAETSGTPVGAGS